MLIGSMLVCVEKLSLNQYSCAYFLYRATDEDAMLFYDGLMNY